MVCILAKGSGDCASPAYHDHPPQRLLQNFPDTTWGWKVALASAVSRAQAFTTWADVTGVAMAA
jgi:hypothetical protein